MFAFGKGFPAMSNTSEFHNSPSGSLSNSSVVQRAQVKWFSSAKGFGFVSAQSGQDDIFLHISSLLEKGKRNLQPGVTIECHVGDGPKGKQVVKIISIDETTLTEQADVRQKSVNARPPVDLSKAVQLKGKVKWYNAFKGFGFVLPDDGGKDVFIHASVLADAGVDKLEPDQSLSMHVIMSDKGREAIAVNV